MKVGRGFLLLITNQLPSIFDNFMTTQSCFYYTLPLRFFKSCEMKKFICLILIISFLFYSVSCTSFYSLNNYEKLDNYSTSSGNLLFILKDNRTFEAEAKKCFFISEPKDLIYGIGDLTNKRIRTGEAIHFEGEISRENIDSIKSITLNFQEYHIYWFNDSLRVAFEDGKFIDLEPESGSDFWLLISNNNKQLFEKIYVEDIKEIQVEKINYLTTSLLVLPVIILCVWAALSGEHWGFGFTPPDPNDVHF